MSQYGRTPLDPGGGGNHDSDAPQRTHGKYLGNPKEDLPIDPHRSETAARKSCCFNNLRGMTIKLVGGTEQRAALSGVSEVFETVRLKGPPEEYQP